MRTSRLAGSLRTRAPQIAETQPTQTTQIAGTQPTQTSRFVKLLFMVLVVAALSFATLASAGCSALSQQEDITSLDQLTDKTGAYVTGTLNLDATEELVGASGGALGFNSVSDCVTAIETGKADLFVCDEPICRTIINEHSDLKIIGDYVLIYNYGAIFGKDNQTSQQVKPQFDEFLSELKAAGTLEQLQNLWFDGNAADQTVDKTGLTGENGTIRLATTSSSVGKPDVYIKNGEVIGYDIDLVYRFCKAYGYNVEILDSDFSGVLAAVASGKADMGIASISISEEREKSFDFSVPYYEGGSKTLVKDASATSSTSFLEGIVSSFQRTFFDESRWQLFAEGVGYTILITLLSLLLGTLLGFVAYMACRGFGRVCTRFVDLCMWLVSGMPTVVLLMVLFYIVFAAVDIDGTGVAVVAFTLVFASSTVGMLRMGVGAVDEGQTEAAYAMGYSRGQGFLKIVLPQALVHIMPTYQSGAIDLLKGTAVVGYIAVQDLTKMGDIVRSATYEAFFPLIAVAIVYFVLEALLKLVLGFVAKRIDSRSRSEATILAGCQAAGTATPNQAAGRAAGTATPNQAAGQAAGTATPNQAAGRAAGTATPNQAASRAAGTATPNQAAGQAAAEIDAASRVAGTPASAPDTPAPNADNTPSTTNNNVIEIRHLAKSFGELAPLRDVNAVVKRGDIISVIGHSGCGKSTLLRALNLIDPPTGGTIIFDGEEVTAAGYDTTQLTRKMGMVFQRWNLFGHWTAIENVMLPQVQLLGRTKSEAYAKSMQLLASVGLADKAMNYPTELSGGQQQRVAIARTLGMDPKVILLDEPTSALDPTMVGEVQAVIMRLAKEGRTMLIVTHDMELARNVCNRAFYMDEGGIYEDGTPEQIFDHPVGIRTRQFINKLRSFDLTYEAGSTNMEDFNQEFEGFCMRSGISTRAIPFILMMLNEICSVLLPTATDPGTLVHVHIDYALKTGEGTIIVRYCGSVLDSSHGDELSWKILNGATSTVECAAINEENFTAQLAAAFTSVTQEP